MDWNRCGVKQYTVEEGALVLAPEAASKVQKMPEKTSEEKTAPLALTENQPLKMQQLLRMPLIIQVV
ncbi:hypothetical protein H634G_05089 [Metarhizium anisopliae BRIP 53293]|uniref:Uncharacterized protein n=1 Tax=Metarhizium anisopliae BRIP 53293 TaxID=1291518 RepID=A0A0D9NZL8_METAN|nr:hypothetical protein H634G_05089 [Metarhizium anisopliae BRIP 53293]KJK87603.1 hypothetical protein H633G_08529 [Metarhizium anisopliae BRIP 53284]